MSASPHTDQRRFSIREMTTDDVPTCLALWASTPGIGLSASDDPRELERFLARNRGLCFVAIGDQGEEPDAVVDRPGAVVATVLCGYDGRRAYVYHLAVERAWRRMGLARAIIDRLRSALADVGVFRVHAMVLSNNSDGRKAWRALGWTFREDLTIYSHTLESE